MGNTLRKKSRLGRLTSIDDIPFYSLRDRVDVCRVSKCYDGDTIHIVLLGIYPQGPYQLKCRLMGIDTAEIRGSLSEEKEFALKTRDYLRNLILDKVIYVKFGDFDSFGRTLANFYLHKKDIGSTNTISQHLIDNGYGYQYDGTKKKKFEEWKR